MCKRRACDLVSRMPKITTPPPRLSNPQIEKAGKAAETARAAGQPTTDERIRNTFLPGTYDRQAFEKLNPTLTPTPHPVGDLYGTAPSSLSALDPRYGFLPVKIPTKAELTGAARVTFGDSGGPSSAEIHAGGKLVVEYAADRSPLVEHHRSVPAFGVTAFIEFQPSGKRVEAPAIGFSSSNGGHIDPRPQSVPIAVDVPPGSTGVSIWFRQFKGADHPGEAWDSNYGRNYQFDVKP